jgi:hypothetical protein
MKIDPFFVVYAIIVYYGVILLKLIDIGMPLSFTTLVRTIIFPFKIFSLHYHIFLKEKDKDLRKAFSALFYPITNFPDTIILYGRMYLRRDALFVALKELFDELDEEKRKELISILIDKGIIEEVKEVRREEKVSVLNPNIIQSDFVDYGKEYMKKSLMKAF